jgi:hypothetical protein
VASFNNLDGTDGNNVRTLNKESFTLINIGRFYFNKHWGILLLNGADGNNCRTLNHGKLLL